MKTCWKGDKVVGRESPSVCVFCPFSFSFFFWVCIKNHSGKCSEGTACASVCVSECDGHRHTEQPHNEHIDLVQQRKRTTLHALIVTLIFSSIISESFIRYDRWCYFSRVSASSHFFFLFQLFDCTLHLLRLFTRINNRCGCRENILNLSRWNKNIPRPFI